MRELCGYLEEEGTGRAKSRCKVPGVGENLCREARVNDAERDNQGRSAGGEGHRR